MRSDEIWDEDRWEAYLRENDRRINSYMVIYHSFLAKYPLPDRDDQVERRLWKDRLIAYFRMRGANPEDDLLNFLLLDGEQETVGYGDVWMPELSEAFMEDEQDDEFNKIRQIPVFRSASGLANEILEWANRLPGKVKDGTFVQFCSCVVQIGANIAKGHVIGYEHDSISGNIAYAKRELLVANSGLQLLQEMRFAPYMDPATYLNIYERTFEVRNQLALYVLDLREQFDLGID